MEKFRVTFDLTAPSAEDAIGVVERMAQAATAGGVKYDTFSLTNAETNRVVSAGGIWSGEGGTDFTVKTSTAEDAKHYAACEERELEEAAESWDQLEEGPNGKT